MTRQEQSGARSVDFLNWMNKNVFGIEVIEMLRIVTDFSLYIRKKLPQPEETDFRAYDVDFCLYRKNTRVLMLLEEKTHQSDSSIAGVKHDQSLVAHEIDNALSYGAKKTGLNYMGYHLVQFEETSPANGRTWFDGIEIRESDLLEVLSLKYKKAKYVEIIIDWCREFNWPIIGKEQTKGRS